MTTPNQSTTAHCRVVRFLHNLEENFIAICLGLMTFITFANVIARYIFNANILWALEVTVFLFAWLVLVGASYGVKSHFHIGVDIVINSVSPELKKAFALISVALCLLFSVLLFIGSWSYWFPFADPEQQSWYEVEAVPMPAFLNALLADAINYGEQYEKMPRFIPYFALPLGMGLLVFRFLQQAWRIWHNQVDTLVAGHEIEELEGLHADADENGQASNGNGDKP